MREQMDRINKATMYAHTNMNIVLFRRTIECQAISFLHFYQKFDLCLGSHRGPLLGFDHLHSNFFIIARINCLENLAA